MSVIIIGAVHPYWALSGSAEGRRNPSKKGLPILSPGRVSTTLVGVALFGMAATIGSAAGFLPPLLPVGVLQGASGLLALIFAARGIGDLRYVGFLSVCAEAFLPIATLDSTLPYVFYQRH